MNGKLGFEMLSLEVEIEDSLKTMECYDRRGVGFCGNYCFALYLGYE